MNKRRRFKAKRRRAVRLIHRDAFALVWPSRADVLFGVAGAWPAPDLRDLTTPR